MQLHRACLLPILPADFAGVGSEASLSTFIISFVRVITIVPKTVGKRPEVMSGIEKLLNETWVFSKKCLQKIVGIYGQNHFVLIRTPRPKPYSDARLRHCCCTCCGHFFNCRSASRIRSVALHRYSILLHARHSADETAGVLLYSRKHNFGTDRSMHLHTYNH